MMSKKQLRLVYRFLSLFALGCASVSTAHAAEIKNVTLEPSGSWSVVSRNLLLNGSQYLREKQLNLEGTSIFIPTTPTWGRDSNVLAFKHEPFASSDIRQRSEYYVFQGRTSLAPLIVQGKFNIAGSSADIQGDFSVITQFQQNASTTSQYISPFVDLNISPTGTQYYLNVHVRNDLSLTRSPNFYVAKRYGPFSFNTWHNFYLSVAPNYSSGTSGIVRAAIDGAAAAEIWRGNLGYSSSVPGQLKQYQQSFGLYRSRNNNSTLRVYFDDYRVSD